MKQLTFPPMFSASLQWNSFYKTGEGGRASLGLRKEWWVGRYKVPSGDALSSLLKWVLFGQKHLNRNPWDCLRLCADENKFKISSKRQRNKPLWVKVASNKLQNKFSRCEVHNPELKILLLKTIKSSTFKPEEGENERRGWRRWDEGEEEEERRKRRLHT